MWIKNARLYRLTSPITVNISDALAQFPFTPCQSLDTERYGFVPPCPGSKMLVHSAGHYGMICAKHEEKILPGGTIKDAVNAKIESIYESEGRRVSRQERDTIKDDVIFSMLPKAFTRSRLQYAYIDLKAGLIVVDAGSARQAEDLLSKLREALGSLRCLPLSVKSVTTQSMTHWVQNSEAPQGFEIGGDVELEAVKDGRIVRCKNHDLSAAEVINHIHSGMLVAKLEMIWKEAITFSIDGGFGIKKLKFADAILDKANDGNPETKAEQFDTDFQVMTLELSKFFEQLIEAFGGEDKSLIDNPVS